MGRSTENSKKAAAATKSIKSAAATSSAKTNRRSSKGDNNTTIHLNEINKPNRSTPIVLTSLGAASASISKLQETTTPSSKQQPIDNIAAAVDQGTAKGKDDSPATPETAPNTPEEEGNTAPAKEASPSDSIATNNSSSTTPPSVAPTPTTEDMNISPKKGAPAATTGNNVREPTAPASKEAASSKGAEEVEDMNISPKKPDGKRSSLKANTPMAPIPQKFAAETVQATAEVLRQYGDKYAEAAAATVEAMSDEEIRTLSPVFDKIGLKVIEYPTGDKEYGISYPVVSFRHGNPEYTLCEATFSLDGSDQAERMDQFVHALRRLFIEILIADPHAAIVPLDSKDTAEVNVITKAGDIPKNLTKISTWVLFRGGAWVFNLRKGQSTANVTATFRLKSSMPATKVLGSVEMEFTKHKGTYLNVKPNQAVETDTRYMLLFASTSMGKSNATTTAEMMFQEAQSILLSHDMDEDDEAALSEAVKFSLRLVKPRLPRETVKNKKLSKMEDMVEKAFHFEIPTEDAENFAAIVATCKHHKLEKRFFGTHAHLTRTLTNESSIGDAQRLKRFILGNSNFNSSTTSVDWQGIVNLEARNDIVNPVSGDTVATVYFRQLVHEYETPSGLKPFLQLYQQSNGDVVVIIPNTPEAETSGEMVARNPAAFFLFHSKQVRKMDDAFVNKLIERTFATSLIHEASKCTLCPETHVLTTPNSRADNEQIVVFENLDWVKDWSNNSTAAQAKEYVDPKLMFNFGEEFSHATLHPSNAAARQSREVNDSQPSHAPDGTPIIYLSKKKSDEEVIDVDKDDAADDISALTNKDVDMPNQQGSEPVNNSRKSRSTTTVEGAGIGPKEGLPNASAASPASEDAAGGG